MPVLIRGNEAVLFIHIPKCGGSSFEEHMKERGWRELLSIRGVHTSQLNFMYCSPQHMHAELLSKIVRLDMFDSIVTIVRDPLRRLMSEYSWQLEQKITSLCPDQWIKYTFEKYSSDPFIFDNHIRPQSEFILDSSLIFKLEENGVNKAINMISPKFKKLKLTSNFFSKNHTLKKLKATNKSIEVIESFDKHRQLIYDFYQKDYKLLGYQTIGSLPN